jgi:hypothetical protein
LPHLLHFDQPGIVSVSKIVGCFAAQGLASASCRQAKNVISAGATRRLNFIDEARGGTHRIHTMKLGFVSAILPDLNLNHAIEFAARERFDCVELMCWPVGKAERKFAGVTHLDVTGFTQAQAEDVNALCAKYCVSISALGIIRTYWIQTPRFRGRRWRISSRSFWPPKSWG